MRPILLLVFLIPFAAAGQSVYRCGSTYSHQPCNGGRAVDVQPAVSDPDASTLSNLYLCETPRGGRFWSQDHCNQRGAAIERIERVPSDLPMHRQAEIANQKTDAAYALQRERRTVVTATAGSTGRGNRSTCDAIDQHIRSLDAAARQPQRPVVQQRIAADRKAARDQQFRMGC